MKNCCLRKLQFWVLDILKFEALCHILKEPNLPWNTQMEIFEAGGWVPQNEEQEEEEEDRKDSEEMRKKE